MNQKIQHIIEWLKAHEFRDQLILLLMSFAVIYTLYDTFLIGPLSREKKELTQKIAAAKKEADNLVVQVVLIVKAVNSKNYKKPIDIASYFHPAASLPKLTSDVLNQRTPEITLVNLKNLLDQPWTIPGENSSSVSAGSIMQHTMQIDFLASYFNTIDYLERLEKLPWRLYWDTLDYRVGKYPQAEVLVKFHVLSKEK